VHDLGVVPGVGRRRHRLDQLVQVRLPPDPGQVTALPQLIGDGDRIGRLATTEEVEDGIKDQLVRRAVEVVRLHGLEAVGDRVLVEQHRPEHRLLGVEVLRGKSVVGGPSEGAPYDAFNSAMDTAHLFRTSPDDHRFERPAHRPNAG
jgi:hypothetical protein